MKECPSCKAKNRNDAVFCTECGGSLKDVPAQAEGWDAAVGGFLNKAKDAAASGVKKAKEAAATGAEKMQKAMDDADQKREASKAAKVSAGGWDTAVDASAYTPAGDGRMSQNGSVLVDQSEQIVATIGSNYLQNFLSGGSVDKGIGILTQKRFYFKGKSFTGSGKDMKSSTQEGVVAVDDISFTNFIYTRPTGLLIAAIIFTIGIVTIPIALFFYIKYFISRQTLFVVSFPGGNFGFDVKYYPIADIRDFQRQLHLLKDHIKEGAAV